MSGHQDYGDIVLYTEEFGGQLGPPQVGHYLIHDYCIESFWSPRIERECVHWFIAHD